MNKFLREIKIEKSQKSGYPFDLPLFKNGFCLKLDSPVTFIVGENGSGKSTLLENLAFSLGFNTLGGNKNHIYENDSNDNFELSNYMKLMWHIKQTKGFFFRAETFFNFANKLDDMAKDDPRAYFPYGGKSLQSQSHGESFLSLFANKIQEGIFILDEPEAALSPEKQLSLISLLNSLSKSGKCQFIIATHSPFLITLPQADLFEIEGDKLVKKNYSQTKQFGLYKDFIANPERFLHYLCN